MATTKQKHTVDTKTMREESKHTTRESHQTSKEERVGQERDRERQRTQQKMAISACL